MTNKTDKKTFEYKTHDKDGNINHGRLNLFLILPFIISLLIIIPLEILALGYINEGLNPFAELGIFEALSLFLINTLNDNFNSWQFNLYFLSSLGISFYIYFINYKNFKTASRYQKKLISTGFSQYFVKNYNKKTKTFIFDLKDGDKVSTLEDFNRSVEKFLKAFKLKRVKFKSLDGYKIEMTVLEELPNVSTVPKMNYTLKMGYQKVLIGIATILGEAVYSREKEEGKGLFNGHWLIVGGTGSGKSFFVKELLKNLLILVNYLLYKKIYIINLKGSADYNFLKKLLKVEYVEDIAGCLKILKKVQLEMFSIYRYNTINSEDNFLGYQTLLIIDEIQTLNETLESKSLDDITKNSVNECNSILEFLGSKARAANISMMVILQKADINSLPSTAFRQNIRNRVMLKQENITSAHLVVNKEFTEKEAINPLEIEQGQGIYHDILKGTPRLFFTVFKEFEIDYESLNNQEFDEETKRIIKEVESYKEIAIVAIQVKNELIQELIDEGKKTFFDSFEDLEDNRFDIERIFKEAEKRIKNRKQETPIIKKEEKEVIEEDTFKIPNIEININEEQEKATTEELNNFIEEVDEVNELKEENINLENEEFNDKDLDDLDFELEELEKEAINKMNEEKSSKSSNKFIDDFKFDDNELN